MHRFLVEGESSENYGRAVMAAMESIAGFLGEMRSARIKVKDMIQDENSQYHAILEISNAPMVPRHNWILVDDVGAEGIILEDFKKIRQDNPHLRSRPAVQAPDLSRQFAAANKLSPFDRLLNTPNMIPC